MIPSTVMAHEDRQSIPFGAISKRVARKSRAVLFSSPHQKHRSIDCVANFVRRRAIKQIADKTVAVRGHGDEIDILSLRV